MTFEWEYDDHGSWIILYKNYKGIVYPSECLDLMEGMGWRWKIYRKHPQLIIELIATGTNNYPDEASAKKAVEEYFIPNSIKFILDLTKENPNV